MKLIAHRGLTHGPNKLLENKPEQIVDALNNGFDCEIDLWVVNNELYLGHDDPTYKIKSKFLEKKEFWIHAKNLEALQWLLGTGLTYFWHQNDDFTLTSNRYIWAYPGKKLTEKSVCVMPEWEDPAFQNLNLKCYGICSDFVDVIRKKL